MKLLLGLLVLAVVVFFVRKAVTKKNAPVKPVNSGGTTSPGSGSGSGQAGSGSGFGSEFNGAGSGTGQGGTKPVSSGSGSGSGSGNGVGSGGSSDGIIIINPGGPTSGSGSGSKGHKGHKGAGLLDVDGNEVPFIKGDLPSDQIKDQLK